MNARRSISVGIPILTFRLADKAGRIEPLKTAHYIVIVFADQRKDASIPYTHVVRARANSLAGC
jgi:hypothetical protein